MSSTDGPADLDDQVAGRAEPLPEETAAGDDRERHPEAAEILRESGYRQREDAKQLGGAAAGEAPGDAADEHRESDEGV